MKGKQLYTIIGHNVCKICSARCDTKEDMIEHMKLHAESSPEAFFEKLFNILPIKTEPAAVPTKPAVEDVVEEEEDDTKENEEKEDLDEEEEDEDDLDEEEEEEKNPKKKEKENLRVKNPFKKKRKEFEDPF